MGHFKSLTAADRPGLGYLRSVQVIEKSLEGPGGRTSEGHRRHKLRHQDCNHNRRYNRHPHHLVRAARPPGKCGVPMQRRCPLKPQVGTLFHDL
jgi:hypothetical protein